ncbi:MAG: presqualene diphosphate synthase HpnD [Sphingomonadales bacterium]|uniref:presqualene diphosphate synthase HpnD n=1 Tax=Novosphingobium sp. NDB2Meth1 TaxID=1892847 RepID=UPI000930A205|nr:presqualene diphosphate synthase HpnD [Novosphingobium sp. NDB2Meth1]MBU6393158.1 presqualene diphosphate synthase HpnD [Sphingomonadales bacterium]
MSAPDGQTQASRSSFYAGMRVLPKDERLAMYAVYDFCRIVDDIADDQQGDRAVRAAELDAWRADIDALYAGRAPGRAAFLATAVHRFALEKADFIAVIDGMAIDVERDVRWPTEAELDIYCDHVASAVGRLSVKIFGMDEEPGLALAHHLGRALQYTNILRDIDEDAAIGRVYMPLEALRHAGIEPTTPEAIATDPRMDAAARRVAARAQQHYKEAAAILAAKPKGHLIAPRLMEIAYSRLLRTMEQIGWAPPRTRVRTNKLGLLLTVFWLLATR